MKLKKAIRFWLIIGVLVTLAGIDYSYNFNIKPLFFIPLAFLALNLSLKSIILFGFLVAGFSAFSKAILTGGPLGIDEAINFAILFSSFSLVSWVAGTLKQRKPKEDLKKVDVPKGRIDKLYLNGIITSYLEALELKDPYLKLHSLNVAKYARLIASELKMPKAKVQELYWAGMLHDIGKVVIPNGVLNLPVNMMSDREKISFYQHTEIGKRMIEHVPGLENVAEMVNYHHETCDGKGYPSKLNTNQIPIGSRILAVANMFDKLTYNKSYLKSYSSSYAMEEIKSQYRSLFDPLVIDALEAVLQSQQNHQIIQRLA